MADYKLVEENGDCVLSWKDEPVFKFREGGEREVRSLDGHAAVFLKDKPLYCDFFRNGCYIYSLRKNDYRRRDHPFMFVEFIQRQTDGKIVVLFNHHHGSISVLDADTGQLIHDDANDDKFISNYRIIGEGSGILYLEGWWWNPIFFTALYDIEKLVTEPSYKAEVIETYMGDEAQAFTLLENDMIRFKEEGKDYHAEELFCSFTRKQRSIARSSTAFNNGRAGASLLRTFSEKPPGVHIDSEAFSCLTAMLSQDVENLEVAVKGKRTGEDLTSLYRDALFTVPEEQSSVVLSHAVPKALFGSLGPYNGLEEISLQFRIVADGVGLTIDIDQPMKQMEKQPFKAFTFYEIDQECEVVIQR